MKEQYITFETAKLAKEKGFMWKHVTFRKMTPGELADPKNERVVKMGVKEAPIWDGDVETGREGAPCYNAEGKEIYPNKYNPRNPHYPRPTQSLLHRWLREKHKLYIAVGKAVAGWVYAIDSTGGGEIHYNEERTYPTYELATEAALQEALNSLP
jgi:hypothetical protein